MRKGAPRVSKEERLPNHTVLSELAGKVVNDALEGIVVSFA